MKKYSHDIGELLFETDKKLRELRTRRTRFILGMSVGVDESQRIKLLEEIEKEVKDLEKLEDALYILQMNPCYLLALYKKGKLPLYLLGSEDEVKDVPSLVDRYLLSEEDLKMYMAAEDACIQVGIGKYDLNSYKYILITKYGRKFVENMKKHYISETFFVFHPDLGPREKCQLRI